MRVRPSGLKAVERMSSVGQVDPGHEADVGVPRQAVASVRGADQVATGRRHDGKSSETVQGFITPAGLPHRPAVPLPR